MHMIYANFEPCRYLRIAGQSSQLELYQPFEKSSNNFLLWIPLVILQVEMEEQRDEAQTDYWLVQYQRLLDSKPQAVIDRVK